MLSRFMVFGRLQPGRVLSAALLLPLILFSALGTSFDLWRCRADGVARASCCCPTKVTKASQAQGEQRLTISRARCCDREQHQVDRDPAEVARSQATRLSDLLAAATSVTPVSPLLLAPPPAISAPIDARASDGPPAARSGRRLVVQKQSFLI
jgi:hypothetical protein